MFKEFTSIKTHKVISNSRYSHPDRLSDIVNLDSSAFKVYTDFHVKAAATITKNTLAIDALEKMIKAKVRCLLVTNDKERIIGAITSMDIQGMKRMQTAQAYSIRSDEVTVSMLMTKSDGLIAIDYKDLSNARVGHIAKILHDNNLHYLFVTEVINDAKPIIVGIFSANRLSHQLDILIGKDLGSTSVADMNKQL